jgi:hypothetical protein
MPGFLDDFSPANGDLVYGITPARNAYISAWEQSVMSRYQGAQNDAAKDTLFKELEAKAKNWHTLDSYNNYYAVPVAGEVKPTQVLDALKSRYESATEPRVKAYLQSLIVSRYSPAVVSSAPQQKVSQEGYRRDHFNDPRSGAEKFFGVHKDKANEKREGRALAQNLNYLAIRRACKFGIGLLAEDSVFVQMGAKIRFVLDGLDMREVATKATRDSNTGVDQGTKQAVSITVSELRYAFRNWGKLNNTVVLYVNLQPVQAPWLTDWGPMNCIAGAGNPTIRAEKALWSAYEAQRIQKHGVNSMDEIKKTLF